MMDGDREQGNLCCEEGKKSGKKEEENLRSLFNCLEIHNPSLLF